jgi:acid stress-induced BolA-like protein IbaG/YrbA
MPYIIERRLKTFILSPMDPNEIKTMIENGMTNLVVNVDGDGTHFEALIVSTEFEGKSLIDRHKLVYGVLGDAMKERIHALSLKTYTPEQWENNK